MSAASDDPRAWEALPKWPRRAVTVWLLFHLIAIISAPASVAPASDLARSVWSVCQPYLQVLYLNHGYHFFAPDPGESTLVSFTVVRADGTTVEETIPNRRIWPRLLYHRHFMLTESLGTVARVSESMLPPSNDRPFSDELLELDGTADVARNTNGPETNGLLAGDEFLRDIEPPEHRGLLRDWYRSYAECALHRFGGERVRVTRVIHYLPQIEWMQDAIASGEPLTLDEPESYELFPVGTFEMTADGVALVPDHEEGPFNPETGDAGFVHLLLDGDRP